MGRRGLATVTFLMVSITRALASQEGERPPVKLESPPPREAPRPQEATLGYRYVVSYPHHIDRENIASEATAAMDLVHLGLQDSGNDTAVLRLFKWGAAAWIDTSVMYVAHEYGHLSSISKTGYREAVEGDVGSPDSMRTGVTPFSLFLEGLTFPAGRIISVSSSDWDHINAVFAQRPLARARLSAAIEAGGINQEQIVADRYTDRLLDGGLSYLDTVPYFWGLLSTLTYPTGIQESDLNDYVSAVERQGFSTSTTRVKALSAVEFASGSSLVSFWGFFQGLFTSAGGHLEPIGMHPWENVRIALPEFASTLSEIGPTLKTAVPIRIGDWTAMPSYEALIVSGERANEAGLEVRAPLASFLELKTLSFFGDQAGRWLEAQVAVRPLPWVSLSMGYFSARGYTFHRDLYGAGNDLLDKGERSLFAGFFLSARF